MEAKNGKGQPDGPGVAGAQEFRSQEFRSQEFRSQEFRSCRSCRSSGVKDSGVAGVTDTSANSEKNCKFGHFFTDSSRVSRFLGRPAGLSPATPELLSPSVLEFLSS
jgi:hypothetical protein